MDSTDSTDSTVSGQRIYEVPEYQGPLTRFGLITNKRLSPGYKPIPGPHRCYSHYKDIGNGLLSDPLEFIKPFSIFWKCMKSEKGLQKGVIVSEGFRLFNEILLVLCVWLEGLARANSILDQISKLQESQSQTLSVINSSSNNAEELDLKYLLEENDSNSENTGEISDSLEDKDFDHDDLSSKRRSFKGHPSLSINTSNIKSPSRLITPDSSDSEFDMSTAHMPLAPTLGNKNSSRANRYSSAEHYENEISVDRRANRINRRSQTDDSYPSIDIQDDNSIISSESITDSLKLRVPKHVSSLGNGLTSERKQRKNKIISVSPSATSPGSSLEGTSLSNPSASQPLTGVAQHHKHLQNAFESFEKLFTFLGGPVDDSSPPPSRSMAMVVSSALTLNTRMRNLVGNDNPPSERSLKALLKTSDEQIRSLTECILALSPLAPKKTSKRMSTEVNGRGYAQYSGDPTLLQMPTPAHSVRSMSPIQRMSSAPSEFQELQNCAEHTDGSTQRTSPIPQSDQPSPTYYNQTQRPRSSSNRISRPPSPGILPENMLDQQYIQQAASRTLDYRELRNRRFSSGAYNSSYSGTLPTTSPSPPPLPHYDSSTSNGRMYYDRNELPRMQRYNHQTFNNTLPSSTVITPHQRTTSRPTSYIRTEEPPYSINPGRNSSLYRSTSGRSYTPRFVGDEFANNSRQQSRMYEFTRKTDQSLPIERRQASASEVERRNGYDQNVYGENVHERDYISRGNDLNKHNPEVQNDSGEVNEENRSGENCENNNICNDVSRVGRVG
ncbi:10363_t:CDS:2 [Diversispora eburnea]|uniref:10363_t:CDS:1 n=1 Tax=Diversispora eburnea TaxID=1213867 RepID=A0A9N8Z5Q5_9GLOM|nr:10363_t:CDS:2 [Diversispora eburnea]